MYFSCRFRLYDYRCQDLGTKPNPVCLGIAAAAGCRIPAVFRVRVLASLHARLTSAQTCSNQLFVAFMVADPEPQEPASPSKSQCPIVQRDLRRPHFLAPGFSNFLEL